MVVKNNNLFFFKCKRLTGLLRKDIIFHGWPKVANIKELKMRKKNIWFLLTLSLSLSLGLSDLLKQKTSNCEPNISDKEDGGALLAQKSSVVQSGEREIDFNYNWSFQKGNLLSDRPYENYYDDSAWESVNLPYDWSIYEDYDPQVSSEIGHLAGGYGWYRKEFTVPDALKGKKITIHFDGVYRDSTVYVNGKKVGNYPNGYVPFSYDITDYLKFGDNEVNVIAVEVINLSDYNGSTARWYSGSGIYRDVTLLVQDALHIDEFGTTINLPDLKKSYTENPKDFSATTSVLIPISNASSEEKTFTVRTTLLDYKTKEKVGDYSLSSQEYSLKPGEKKKIVNDLAVKNPKRWSTEHPNLYYIQSELLEGDKVIETRLDRFGYRFFDWFSYKDATERGAKGEGFFLNGEFVNLKGVCRHHDQGALGAVANPTAIYRQRQTRKDRGVNSIRITHNVADTSLLQACDERGFLAIEEFFDSWYSAKAANDFWRFFEKQATHPDAKEGQTWAEFDVRSVIKRHRNYPSIVRWSVGNEIWDTHNFNVGSAEQAKGLKTRKNLVSYCHESDVDAEDDSRSSGQRRFVTIGQNQWKESARPLLAELDAVGYNYWYNLNFGSKYDVSDWRFYGSETSSAVKSRGYYRKGGAENSQQLRMEGVGDQCSSFDNSSVPWGGTASYYLKRIQENKSVINQESTNFGATQLFMAGEYVWTGFDYRGEPTPWNQLQGRNPHSSFFGIVDTAGFAKDDYYLYQSQWLDGESDPRVHIVGHYNWEDPVLRAQRQNEDGSIPIKVYSNADAVELFLQKPGEEATSLGRKEFVEYTKTNHSLISTYQRSKDSPNKLYLEWNNLPQYAYQAGTKIIAKAYKKEANGSFTEIQRDVDKRERNHRQNEIVTSSTPYKVVLTPEKKERTADGYDLIYIDAEIQDKDGNFCPNADNLINFAYIGDAKVAKIEGVDNGNADSWERAKDYNGSWRRQAFNGRALLIVKAKKDAGMFSIQATSTGLMADVATLFAKAGESLPTDKEQVVYYYAPQKEKNI